MDNSRASSTNVELEIVHAVKGRVRLRLKSDDARQLLPNIAHHLRQQAGIHIVQIKQTSNSLVVTFNPEAISAEQLTDLLYPFGSVKVSTEAMLRRLGGNPEERLHQEVIAQSTSESHTITYSRLFSLVPPLVGLGVARGLGVSGWKSILTYILAAGLTREVIDQVTEESAESENTKLSPAKSILSTEIVAEEISTLLGAIETDYEIVHQIPGRIRLRVPKINRDSTYAQELKRLLEQDNRIIDLRFKTNSSSVVILYDTKVLSDANQEKIALNNSNGKVDRAESSTIPDQKTKEQKPTRESDLNDTPPADDETSSEPKYLTSDTETEIEPDANDNLETEAESTAPIADDASEKETHQEFSNGEIIAKAGCWSDFKSSMLLTMLQLMGSQQVKTSEI